MVTKNARHFAIKEIIASADVESQDDLRRQLKKQGFDVTQATLSRDIKEMAVRWVNRPEGGRYELPSPEDVQLVRPGLEAQVVSIAANESLVIVHTLSGSASIVGEYIDHMKCPDILGTVAGDNTVLVVPSHAGKTQYVIRILKDSLIKG